ncbi:SET domain-containing protein RMS1 [Lindgomyces ingoldianus]|uniref:SET domain-containing protein RMS1 n=1 Tax=Lindgomyces ingoldianus TaxID=673940 RepID=A0ACB6R794_9PLEO|nr:SET domain-containing protein RMS1 [Lindgomyces ingoldianus]KAF2474185.1 SET domain-containing protein RMS1 [Lindgomyces ingoldianus]
MLESDALSWSFMAWLASSGAEISAKIQLADLKEKHAGRGVVALQDVQEEEFLFRIPRSLILSVENSDLPSKIPSAFADLDPWLSLILVMLYELEKGKESKWHAYFDILPKEFNTLMFWEPDELAQLQASAVVGKIGKEEADKGFEERLLPIIAEYKEVLGIDFPDNEANKAVMLKQMHKLASTIMAYAFDIEPTDARKEVDEEGYMSEEEDEALPKGMVPLADMLNADADRNNARLFYEENSLSMKALKSIKAGEEIFNDYGPLPRSDLLRRYGYITDNYAKYDVAEIPFYTASAVMEKAGVLAEDLKSKFEYLESQGVVEDGYTISTSSPFDIQESIAPELIIMIEALLLPDHEFDRIADREKLPKPDKISIKGAQLLIEIITTHMKDYTTTLEEDIAEKTVVPLTSSDVSRERRYMMAKLVRIGEKKILRDAVEALDRLIEHLVVQNKVGKKPGHDSAGPPKKRQRVE